VNKKRNNDTALKRVSIGNFLRRFFNSQFKIGSLCDKLAHNFFIFVTIGAVFPVDFFNDFFTMRALYNGTSVKTMLLTDQQTFDVSL